MVFLLGKFMRKVFFGQLRAAEMEVEFFLNIYDSLDSSSQHTFIFEYIVSAVNDKFI